MRGKGTVETSFGAVGSLFAQYVAGYAGNSVENRGKDAETGAVWSMVELQELLDEWIVAGFTDRSTACTCPDLRLLIEYMSATESGGCCRIFFGVPRKALSAG